MVTLCANVAVIANEPHALTALCANVMTIVNEPCTLSDGRPCTIAYTHYTVQESKVLAQRKKGRQEEERGKRWMCHTYQAQQSYHQL